MSYRNRNTVPLLNVLPKLVYQLWKVALKIDGNQANR